MSVRSRNVLIAPNMLRRAVAYPRESGRQVITGFSVSSSRPLLAVIGWDGTENCGVADGTVVTVKFNQNVNYTDQTGITIVNNTTGAVFNISSVADAGLYALEYTGAWTIADPIFGDDLEWDYDGLGNYEDDEGDPMPAGSLTLSVCADAPLELLSIQVFQEEGPGAGARIIRKSMIAVQFNQRVVSASVVGVATTVHGAGQSITLERGSGTDTLVYRIQRAIFRHEVTWTYTAALGDIVTFTGGEALGDVSTQIAVNNLPVYTVFDYNAGAANGFDTDTKFDDDETRHDEE